MRKEFGGVELEIEPEFDNPIDEYTYKSKKAMADWEAKNKKIEKHAMRWLILFALVILSTIIFYGYLIYANYSEHSKMESLCEDNELSYEDEKCFEVLDNGNVKVYELFKVDKEFKFIEQEQ